MLVAGSELSSWLRVEECGGVSACAVPGFVDNLFFSGCANVIGVLWRLFSVPVRTLRVCCVSPKFSPLPVRALRQSTCSIPVSM